MNNTPFFSIIVPVYKVELYLAECVNSILMQTFHDYEIILIDDGSPDNCPAICDMYSRENDTVKVIHKENGGLSDARNAGIKTSNGEYIIFLDSDDKLANNSVLEELYNFIKQESSQIIYCPCLARFSNNEIPVFSKYLETGRLTSSKLFVYTKQCNSLFAAWLFVIKRLFILENNLFFTKGLLHEDMDWIPRLLTVTDETVMVFPKDFYLYRFTENSITSSFTTKRFDNIEIIIHTCESIFKDLNDTSKQQFIIKWINMLIYMLFVNVGNIEKEDRIVYETCRDKIIKLYTDINYCLNFRNKIIYYGFKIFSLQMIFHLRNLLKRIHK